MAEAVPSDGNSKIQESVDDFLDQTLATKFQLNEIKCKELRITFSKSDPILDPIVVNNQPLETVKVVRNSFPFSITTELYERFTRL